MAHLDVPDGAGLYFSWPFKVPPELGFWTVSAHGGQACRTPQGMRGIRYAMGHDVGQQGEDSILSMRHRL